MSEGQSSKITVFYSWQSDLPRATNNNFIRDALKVAKGKIESTNGPLSAVFFDEATRDLSGAPHIPSSILNKIAACDVFVADVSIIHADGVKPRRTPNPNVLVELGYAIALLGWSRIVLIFNQAVGAQTDLPFDFEKNRLTQYSLLESDSSTDRANRLSNLAKTMIDALGLVYQNQPARPFHADVKAIQRARDVRMLRGLCQTFDIASVQSQCDNALNGYTTREILYYHDWFDRLLGQLEFHLYDSKAEGLARQLNQAWQNAIPDSRFSGQIPNDRFKFDSSLISKSKEASEAHKKMIDSPTPLYNALREFLSHMRDNYIEIDLSECSREARSRWSD